MQRSAEYSRATIYDDENSFASPSEYPRNNSFRRGNLFKTEIAAAINFYLFRYCFKYSLLDNYNYREASVLAITLVRWFKIKLVDSCNKLINCNKLMIEFYLLRCFPPNINSVILSEQSRCVSLICDVMYF